jgi:ubiquinone biosynthesis protein Coq4
MFNLPQRLQSLRMVAALGKFLKNPDQLDSVFAVAQSLQNSPLANQMHRHLLANPQMAELVETGWRPPAIDLDALDALPEDSLGHTYARHLKEQGLDPAALIDPSPITSSRDYLVHRLRETHDIVHVLTGFGTDGIGELGLQAFNLAQVRSPLAAMLIFGGLLKTLEDDEPIAPLLKALSQGFEMGMAARCLIAYRLEDHWERPLGEWRCELGLPD